MTPDFHFSSRYLQQLAATHRDAYRSARPFPHAVIDDFMPEDVLDLVVAEFPEPSDSRWWALDSSNERKLTGQDHTMFGPVTRHVLEQLNAAAFLDFLEGLTGIAGLIPDPHFHGGGLHQVERGGHLSVHADFNRHPVTGLERRLNLLLYLNRGWQDAYAGALELWDKDLRACEQRILPVFNRCVVFTTSRFSYHGHPDPLACPEGMARRSLALYYFSRERPATEDGENVRWYTHFAGDAEPTPAVDAFKRGLRRWLPPVAVDAAVAIRERLRGGRGDRPRG